MEQAGIPLPAYPTLIIAAALTPRAGYTGPEIAAVAVVADVIADFGWYYSGVRMGRPVLSRLCRISLSPDSCVRQTESLYLQWNAPSLLVAKFFPGFAAVATALAGSVKTDGLQMLRQLKPIPEMSGITIIVITGLDAEEIEARGGVPSGIPILPKPIPFDRLQDIATVLDEGIQRGLSAVA